MSSIQGGDLLAATTAATIGLDDPIPIDPQVKIGQLENGLRFYIRENVKESLRRTRETNLESNSHWITQLAHSYRRGHSLAEFWGYEESIEEISVQRVRAAAERYFDMGNYVQVTLFPEPLKGGRM